MVYKNSALLQLLGAASNENLALEMVHTLQLLKCLKEEEGRKKLFGPNSLGQTSIVWSSDCLKKILVLIFIFSVYFYS